MNFRKMLAAGVLSALAATAPLAAIAPSFADALASGMIPGAGDAGIRVMSFKERRFRYVVRQETDFTCGSAAVATILRYAFGVPVDEPQVTRALLAIAGDQARNRGFSLLEIKEFLQRSGFNGDGFRVPIATMPGVIVPTIALINVDGYEHFVVIRRVTPAMVYIADPALGNRQFSVDEFESVWKNKIIFRIQGPNYRGDNELAHFELPEGTSTLAESIPPHLDPLSTATLMSIGPIPAVNRL